MITVHHLNNSRSHRIVWLLEELALPYRIKRYARDPRTMFAPAELQKVHPLGKAPVISDGDITMAESGAIIEYLVTRYGVGLLQPTVGSPEWSQYIYWLHYAEGSAMPPLLLRLVADRLGGEQTPWLVRPMARQIGLGLRRKLIDPQIDRHLNFMEAALSGREWFAGSQFTAADVQMSFPLEAAAARAGLDAGRPRLWNWLQRIHARPAYQRALENGGAHEPLR
jgi:glutathione S-transferase